MTKPKIYNVGIYVRLSKEDSRTGESVSIENQKLMLVKHAQEMGWKIKEIYQDDGFSGTNQNRPAFKRMMADVASGFINAILIKDLSRLGRNYLEVGNLAEVFLPAHDCELISLNEKLDDMMVFRNWFNEQHSKTSSIKIRAARRISAQSGKFLGAYAPYGYKKDAQNRHKLVVDEVVAPIVREIFQMRASGLGFRAIAEKLNRDKIITPKEYYYQGLSRKNPTKTRKTWSESTIKDILKNEVYIGNLVAGKYQNVSFKNSKQKRLDESDWIKAEGTHKAIIEKEMWDRVKAFSHKKYKPRKDKSGKTGLFSGLVYCADCGFKMRRQSELRRRKDNSEHQYTAYICSTYANNGKSACSFHCIGEKPLKELVFEYIRQYAKDIQLDKQHIARKVLANNNSPYREAHLSKISAFRDQANRLEILIETLYNDRVSGKVPESLFVRHINKYEQEHSKIMLALKESEKHTDSTKPPKDADLLQLAQKYAATHDLDTEALLLLIDKIVIEAANYIEGKRVCDVRIVWNI